MPSYIPGCIGFILASLEKVRNKKKKTFSSYNNLFIYLFKNNQNKDFTEPLHSFDAKTVQELKLNYYSSKMHKAAFILPNKFHDVNILKNYRFNY